MTNSMTRWLLLLAATLLMVPGCKKASAPAGNRTSEPVAVTPERTAGHIIIELNVTTDTSDAIEVLNKRVAVFARSKMLPHADMEITASGPDRITLRLPLGASDCQDDGFKSLVERLRSLVTRSGQLGFHRVNAPIGPDALKALRAHFGDSLRLESRGRTYVVGHSVDFVEGDLRTLFGDPRDPSVTPSAERILVEKKATRSPGDSETRVALWSVKTEPEGIAPHIASADVTFHDPDSARPAVSLNFDEVGTERFAKLSTELVDKYLGIVFEGRVQSAPIVNEPITGGRASISLGAAGDLDFLLQEAWEIVAVLTSGQLAGETSIERTETTCAPPPTKLQ